jgi:tripartite-type tricarboxylate transporter receptor subunit TctC
MRKVGLSFISLTLTVLTACTCAQAGEGWPLKAVRFIVPFPAGSAPDIVARSIGDVISRNSGQPVTVENKPGASGAIGADTVMREKPDGYTLLVTINSYFTLTPYVTKMSTEPLAEFMPIAEATINTLVLTGNRAVPAQSFKELNAYVKANPGRISFASYSPATVSHLAGLLLNDLCGLDLNHVGYKGAGPALTDLIGGHVPLMVDAMSTASGPIKDGRIRAYAVNSATRHPLAPEVPTFRELGYPEMELLTAWVGVFALNGTPKEVASASATSINNALTNDQVRSRLTSVGLTIPPAKTPTQIKSEMFKEAIQLKDFVAKKKILMTQ